MRDYTVTTLGNSATLTLIENNDLRAAWKIDLEMMIPASADLDSRNRSEKFVPLTITTYLTLSKGAKYLEIKTKINNISRDHRLQVMIPTDVKSDFSYADGPFDILKRNVQWDDTAENMEGHHPFKPMLNFVDMNDSKSGIAFLSKGLNEYEVIDDERRTMAITLLRTTRHYMAANRSLFTPEEYEKLHAGQHCLGDCEIEYAIYPHSGNASQSAIFNVAQDYKIEQRILQGVPKKGKLKCSDSFITLAPNENIHISALYKQENSKNYILRIWNSGNKTINAKIDSMIKFKSVKKIAMDEEKTIGKITKKNGKWIVPTGKAEIVTLLLEV